MNAKYLFLILVIVIVVGIGWSIKNVQNHMRLYRIPDIFYGPPDIYRKQVVFWPLVLSSLPVIPSFNDSDHYCFDRFIFQTTSVQYHHQQQQQQQHRWNCWRTFRETFFRCTPLSRRLCSRLCGKSTPALSLFYAASDDPCVASGPKNSPTSSPCSMSTMCGKKGEFSMT